MPGPHDSFARFTFDHPERAAAELRAVLPAELSARIDWSSLRNEPGSVVDPELKETQSDLLFSARLHGGQPLLLYLLLEHQSSVDRWMALRMLSYVVRQLGRWHRREPNAERLPVVVPVVMYHGPEGRWTAARRIEDLFQLPDEDLERWRTLVPRFEYLLDDLTAEREEALKARAGPPLVRLALLLLRYGRAESLAPRLEGWKTLFAEVHSAPEGWEHLGTVVRYLLMMESPAAYRAVQRVLKSVAGEQRSEALMKTMADELIEQGHQRGWMEGQAKGHTEGRTEGRTQERAEGVLRILAARGISVSDKARQYVLSCSDLAELDRWFDRALTATRFKDILDD